MLEEEARQRTLLKTACILTLNMASLDRVLLVGASGLLGRAIQTALLGSKQKHTKLGVLTSSSALPDPSKDEYWASLAAKGVHIIKVDFTNKEELVEAFSGNITYYFKSHMAGCADNFCRMGCGN
jgi:nucleoside-diphosphate-sugar epimerase